MSEDGYSDSYDEPTMDLLIETLTGTSFEMKVCPSDTVLDIKNKIQRVEGIPVHHQNLLFRLNELKDHSRLCDVGIQSGSVLKLVLSMRGGPISTRRLSSADQHIWKNLKELLENTREELGDKLGPGSKVSVLVFKDGDIINLIRVIENDTGAFYPMGDSITNKNKHSAHEDSRTSFSAKLKENDDMLAKLTELRRKMSELTLKRNLRHMGCSSDTVCCKESIGMNKSEKETKEKSPKKKDKHTSTDSKKRESFYNISFKLLEDMDNDEKETAKKNGGSKAEEENSQNEEDSIALKEKHRGNKSKQNFLYTNFSETRLRPEKMFKMNQNTPAGFQCRRKSDDAATFATENSEKPNSSCQTQSDNTKLKQPCYKKVKLSPKSARKETSKLDEDLTTWSPLLPFLNRRRHMRQQEGSVNIPEVPCQINLTCPAPTSSIAILEEEEAENEEKELISPIGVPCVGTVSMSKVPDLHPVHLTPIMYSDRTKRTKNNPEKLDLENNCDTFSEESKESCRSSANCKFSFLRRRQRLDCLSKGTNKSDDQGKPSFYQQLLLKKYNGEIPCHCFVPTGPTAVSGEFTPCDEPQTNSDKVDLEDNCDIYSEEPKESNCKLGFLRRRQKLDSPSKSANKTDDQSKSSFYQQLLFKKYSGEIPCRCFVPTGPTSIPSEYTPRDDAQNNSDKLNLEDNCDIYSREPKETCRSTSNCKFGLLRSHQSVDCASRSVNETSDQTKSSFYQQLLCKKFSGQVPFRYFVPVGPSAIPSEYTPRDDSLGDYCLKSNVDYSRFLRSPLYKRQPQMTNTTDSEKDGTDYTPRDNSLGDFCLRGNVDYSRLLRSPLYKGQQQTLSSADNEKDGNSTNDCTSKGAKPRNLKHFSWNSHVGSTSPSNSPGSEPSPEFHKRCDVKGSQLNDGLIGESETKTGAKDCGSKVKVLELPVVVAKKKIRCGLCNKRLNITNMYDCRCGGIFCSQHRYSEVHGCKFDYKTEGHKVLEKQNPLVVAEKLQKF